MQQVNVTLPVESLPDLYEAIRRNIVDTQMTISSSKTKLLCEDIVGADADIERVLNKLRKSQIDRLTHANLVIENKLLKNGYTKLDGLPLWTESK